MEPESAAAAAIQTGLAHHRAGRLLEAERIYRRVLELEPDNADALHFLGVVAHQWGRHEAAVELIDRALALSPNYAQAHSNRGLALQRQGRLDEALASYRTALSLTPDHAEAHYNLGTALYEQGRREEALASYRRAVACRPEWAEPRWALVVSQLPAICRDPLERTACRAAFAAALEELDAWLSTPERIEGGVAAVGIQQPFFLAYQEENNRELLSRYGGVCSRLMGSWLERQGLAPAEPARDGVTRLGIASTHFHKHSVWFALTKGWLQHLDRGRFEMHCFHLGTGSDEETAFARSCAASFTEGRRPLGEWAQAMLGRRLDVLIYPEIGMDPTTLQLAAMRLARVQALAWGHPETSGLPSIDYYLSAEAFEPADAQAGYSESLVPLPHLGCCYSGMSLPPAAPELAALGIDAAQPILLAPGVPFKYAPEHDEVFPAIARELGRCQLVFFSYRNRYWFDLLQRRLASAFARFGLRHEDFVVCVPWQEWPAFAGLLGSADVYLDSIGFSGFNTAMQAVERGLPIVTREGRFMRGRFASAILGRIGLAELVAPSDDAYVRLAVRLAQDEAYRRSVRERMERARGALFGDMAPIRAMEEFLARVTRA